MGLRIAIDTGGTFTDVVAIDEETGEITSTKTPSTPEDPSLGLLEGVKKVLAATGAGDADVHMLLHGSTVATNAVLEHKFDGLGLLVTKGFRHLIEIARQSVPDGYGNSFFWVKPRRLVPLHLVREVPGRMRFDGSMLEPLDEAAVIEAAEQLVEDGVTCIAVCLLHSYANDAHEKRVGQLIAERFPNVFVSLSSVVLPEYREYERAMTTLIDVLVKPYCRTYLQRAADKIASSSGTIPFLIMQSNGGIVKHSTAGERPVTMLLSGPAAGVLGSVHTAQLAGFRDILTIDVGGTSTDVSIIENSQPRYTSTSMVESYPVKTPMLDIVTVGSGGGSIVWTDQYGQLKVGPQSAGANPGPICYGKGGTQPTVTDAAVVLGRLPSALVGGEIALDAAAARQAFVSLGREFGLDPDELAAGALEIAAANQVFGIRQVTTVRGREPGDYAMVAFGGAGGLFATEVADFLGIGTVISPPDPGNLCAFGLHVCDVTRDYIRTLVRRQSLADADEIIAAWRDLGRLGFSDIEAEGIPERCDRGAFRRRCPLFRRRPRGPCRDSARPERPRGAGFHVGGIPQRPRSYLRLQLSRPAGRRACQSARTRGRNAKSSADQSRRWRAGVGRALRPPQGVLAVNGLGRGAAVPPHRACARAAYRGTGHHRGIRLHHRDTARLVAANRPLSQSDPVQKPLRGTPMLHAPSRRVLGPIELEVIHGTIRAAELEIEAAVERTSRSPMIRDQHDYRVALFDAKGRKLTGRSYSAIVEPVFEYFGADDIHPGDVFFWNDPYNSSGGIGHVPDLCTTVPIFYDDRLIGFSQVFGHHDDVGGSVPGSLPVHATDSWMEGILIPPIKLYERGKRNEAAFRIIVRNSRLSEHLKGDLDAEQGAARLGCRRIEALAARYGVETLEMAFEQIFENTAEIFRREILPEDPRRCLSFRGLHRSGRRGRAAPAHAPPDDDQNAGKGPAGFHRNRSGGQGADQLGARRG